MFTQEVSFKCFNFVQNLHKGTLVKNGPAIESEWGRMKVRETTSVQEHVVLTNIKALTCACVNACILTLSHTHTLKLPCL